MQSEKQIIVEKKFQFFQPQEEVEARQNQLKKIKEAATILGIFLFVCLLIFATLGNETMYTNHYWY